MPDDLKTGAKARVKPTPPIEGTVVDRRINKERDELELLLAWTEADGDVVQRWFDADELEAAQ